MTSNVYVKEEQQGLRYIIRSGIAGGFAGCVAKTVVAPLDRVKILFQTSNPDFQKYAGTWSGAYRAGAEIYKSTGVWGLFQGHSATLLRIFPYAAIKYMFYDQIHLALMPTRESETNLRRFVAGSLSGTLSVCCTYPLELTRVRLAYVTRSHEDGHKSTGSRSTRPTLRTAISDIYHETTRFKPSTSLASEVRTPSASPARALRTHLFYRFPILSFYRGFTVTMLGMVPYAGTSFLTWGYLRALFLPPPTPERPKPKATPLADLTFGALAGSAAQTVSYPFEIVRRRMQVGGLTNPDPRAWLTFSETVKRVWSTRGWRGFYVGLGIGLAKVVPMTATSFAVWQWGKRVLDV
ncbi:mitochondrial carrier [Fomitiporia mediterranea MF3/22]|uniref:mitochondrial carrier n=1 Tax=Fomitiporia mediterranea (strain MF3/22) TaxID=694068 RepID=UPI0004409477|nr:mitochondrial carrier [Fomitiporia mediterranea MF3/22]EJD07102.1 mitochondrial carrier [Fomitiporia mediterranea MF3/22]